MRSNYGDITIYEEVPLPNYIRWGHISVSITLAVKETLLHNPRRINHGGVTITYDAEEILVLNSRRSRNVNVMLYRVMRK
jgi:hypothetical protein